MKYICLCHVDEKQWESFSGKERNDLLDESFAAKDELPLRIRNNAMSMPVSPRSPG